MIKKRLGITIFILAISFSISGCGNTNYKDGTYTAKSSVLTDDQSTLSSDGEEVPAVDGYGEVTITIKDNKVVDCEFNTFEKNGKKKDEDYGKADGKVANEDYYKKAQHALSANKGYASQLKEAGNLDGVDAISGATVSFDQFKEAVENALDQASE